MDAVVTAVLTALVALVATALARPLVKYAVLKYKLRNLDGPRGLPFFGSIFQMGSDGVAFLKKLSQWSEEFREQGFFLLFLGMKPFIVITSPEDMERVMSNSKLDQKSFAYKFFEPWLGDGLLMSTGPKWAHRRKLLTPSFHFTILNKFLEVFNERAECFTEKLCGMDDGRSVDITPLVSLCTLDIICETIMGHKLGAQEGKNKEYVDAVHSFGSIFMQRVYTPWYWNESLFKLSDPGKEIARCLEVLHNLTRKVIRERKLEMLDHASDKVVIDDQTMEVRKRRRLAFLDLLLEVQKRDETLTDEGIQEEVDTFMFEGHDTVSSAIAFSLHLIGSHPDVQEKLHQELDRVFGGQKEKQATQDDLAKLEYLGCVIKECHRLLPPVPSVGRKVDESVSACGITVPPGVMLFLDFFDLHRDPRQFPKPDQFDPDRFLTSNSENRHHFAHLPFSAGNRNCIGQKFALLEQKVILATILRKLRLTSLQKTEDLRLASDVILRSTDGLHLKFERRM